MLASFSGFVTISLSLEELHPDAEFQCSSELFGFCYPILWCVSGTKTALWPSKSLYGGCTLSFPAPLFKKRASLMPRKPGGCSFFNPHFRPKDTLPGPFWPLTSSKFRASPKLPLPPQMLVFYYTMLASAWRSLPIVQPLRQVVKRAPHEANGESGIANCSPPHASRLTFHVSLITSHSADADPSPSDVGARRDQTANSP
jgi:hypothetical protein